MLIFRCISFVLLFILFGCGGKYTQSQVDTKVADATKGMYTQSQVDTKVADATKGMYTQSQVDTKVADATKGMYTQSQVDTKVADATKGMYTQSQVDTKVADATKGMYTQSQVDTKVADATKGMIPKANYDSLETQLIEARTKAATAKAEKTIELAKQINFFGFDEEASPVPHLNEAKRELEEAEQKLERAKTNSQYGDLVKKSVEHADTAFKLRTEIVYYSLIRYHYRLGEKYKERGEREEKLEAYQEAYKIAKQLFENATRIDSQSSLFNDTAYYLAKMALDFYGDRRLTTAEKIYELIKKYRWREGRVQKLINELGKKVGD